MNMKKCPFCKAEIEENARFCLYCMTSLEEKERLETPKENNKRWLLIIAAVLVFVIIASSVWLVLRKDKSNQNELTSKDSVSFTDSDSSLSEGENSSNTSENQNPTEESSKNSSGNKVSSPQNSSVSGGNTQTSNDKGNKQNTTHTQTNTNETSTPNTNTDNSVSDNKTSDESKREDTDSQNSKEEETTQPTTVTYTYIIGTSENCYPPGEAPLYAPENTIVITGVNNASPDGIYVVPETIDGKKVAAIMKSAFCDPEISQTVKSITLPASVKTIWDGAFSKCYNLTDIYIKSAVVAIYENAFPEVSKRTDTLTIHCAKDCRNFDFYYYRNIADNYGAIYQEWNG